MLKYKSFLVSELLTRGVKLIGSTNTALRCYEANIDFQVRFMADTNLVGCGWVELPPKRYTIKSADTKSTACQIEVSLICHFFSLS